MRTFSAAAFLSIACATGIYCQNLGSFDTFTDTQCSEGREGVTIPDLITYHTVSSNFASVKSYSLECDRKFPSQKSILRFRVEKKCSKI